MGRQTATTPKMGIMWRVSKRQKRNFESNGAYNFITAVTLETRGAFTSGYAQSVNWSEAREQDQTRIGHLVRRLLHSPIARHGQIHLGSWNCRHYLPVCSLQGPFIWLQMRTCSCCSASISAELQQDGTVGWREPPTHAMRPTRSVASRDTCGVLLQRPRYPAEYR